MNESWHSIGGDSDMMKHSRLLRIGQRAFLKLVLIPVRLTALFNHRLYMVGYLPILRAYGMKISGVPRFISPTCYFDDIDHISLGDRVVISSDVCLLTHDYSLTTGLLSIGQKPPTDIARVRAIDVGNNVFIGWGSILLPGTRIGDNVVIGAGSVVRGEVPSDSVVIGNPAQIIGKLTDYVQRWTAEIECRVRRD